VHPKQLTGECGLNYRKELYPVEKTYTFNYIPLLIL